MTDVETVRVKIDHSRPSIPIDNVLKAKGFTFLQCVKDDEPVGDRTKVATIEASESIGDMPMIHICVYEFKGREDVPFSHNLETVMDHSEGVTSMPMIVFAFCECIRQHFKCDEPVMHMVNAETGKFDIYM